MNIPKNKIDIFNKDLAIILAQLAYHISPEIVKYIVERNKAEQPFFEKLFGNNIDIGNYLFDGSDCVFPGCRRWDTQKGDKIRYNSDYNAIIDDNSFPKHIWGYLYNGKSSGWEHIKKEFELAHIFAHKDFEINSEKSYFKNFNDKKSPLAQFTSASNVVLLPKGTVRPTDNSTIIKAIFYKRHIDLYGDSTLNGRSEFKHDSIPDWYSELKWNEPFKPDNWKQNIDALLDYRTKRIFGILKNAGIVPEGIVLPTSESIRSNRSISKLKGTKGQSKKDGKDHTTYLLNGNPVGGKCPLVRAVIRKYVEQNQNITIEELRRIFPDGLNQTRFGVINTYDNAKEINTKETSSRYNINHTVNLNNGGRIAVCTQWNPKNITKFIGKAEELGFNIIKQKREVNYV